MDKRERYDEFEEWLKEQADSHRMYPSDFLWQNIQKELHGEQKWPALTYLAIFIICCLITGTIINKPVMQPVFPVTAQTMPGAKTAKPVYGDFSYQLEPNQITQRTISNIRNRKMAAEETATLAATAVVATSDVSANVNSEPTAVEVPEELKNESLNARVNIVEIQQPSLVFADVIPLQDSTSVEAEPAVVTIEDKMVSPTVEELTKFNLPVIVKHNQNYKWELQFYVTPSGSYRRLVDENKGATDDYITALPMSSNYYVDVNQVVRHKPSVGLEAGVSAGYRITKSLTVKGGLQFNLRQYNIDAYVYRYEVASLEMQNNQTYNSFTKYRNINGSFPITLKNSYFEVSMPIGIDYKKHFSKRLAWGITASVQPTYVFNKQQFVISTDYKNYAEGSALLRNWNLNTAVETYVSYQMGNMRWQIGPQFRYQQLPSFENKYPIKEFLFDYGIKLGVTKAIR